MVFMLLLFQHTYSIDRSIYLLTYQMEITDFLMTFLQYSAPNHAIFIGILIGKAQSILSKFN